MKFVGIIFQGLFEDTTVTTSFLKSHICNISFIEFHMFAKFNNKELRNFKVRPNHSILKARIMVHGKTFQV